MVQAPCSEAASEGFEFHEVHLGSGFLSQEQRLSVSKAESRDRGHRPTGLATAPQGHLVTPALTWPPLLPLDLCSERLWESGWVTEAEDSYFFIFIGNEKVVFFCHA